MVPWFHTILCLKWHFDLFNHIAQLIAVSTHTRTMLLATSVAIAHVGKQRIGQILTTHISENLKVRTIPEDYCMQNFDF